VDQFFDVFGIAKRELAWQRGEPIPAADLRTSARGFLKNIWVRVGFRDDLGMDW
jgi:hypothetical protein